MLKKLPRPETPIAVQELPGGDIVGNTYTRVVRAVYASGECANSSCITDFMKSMLPWI